MSGRCTVLEMSCKPPEPGAVAAKPSSTKRPPMMTKLNASARQIRRKRFRPLAKLALSGTASGFAVSYTLLTFEYCAASCAWAGVVVLSHVAGFCAIDGACTGLAAGLTGALATVGTTGGGGCASAAGGPATSPGRSVSHDHSRL